MKVAVYLLTASGVTRQIIDAVDDCLEILSEEKS